MRLTKNDKAAFVRAVLQDVPATDYNEQASKLVMDAVVEEMPTKVRAVWEDKKLRHFIACSTQYSPPGLLLPFYIPPVYMPALALAELEGALEGIAALEREQRERLRTIRIQLRATIEACSTLKQAKERLPEFVKYLPADRDTTGVLNLPAVANVVSALIDAGWPKCEKGAGDA